MSEQGQHGPYWLKKPRIGLNRDRPKRLGSAEEAETWLGRTGGEPEGRWTILLEGIILGVSVSSSLMSIEVLVSTSVSPLTSYIKSSH